MNLETTIQEACIKAIQQLYGQEPQAGQVQLQKTRKEFEGDLTLVAFPLLKISRKKPEDTATEIGEYLAANVDIIQTFNVVKGFLNLVVADNVFLQLFSQTIAIEEFGFTPKPAAPIKIMVEYSSPNTNKPLHLGHIRNNLLGFSVCRILEANGREVIKTNIVNDRGIHICKSMLAWQKWGKGDVPGPGRKGDKLVGDYYVMFDKEYKAQIAQLVQGGMEKEEAGKKAPIILEAQEMLRKWEARDEEVMKLWKTMNEWVYAGFDVTYRNLGVSFDHIYYESDTYTVGRDTVLEGLEKGLFIRRDDNSVWADLTNDGLDQKLLLRADGTSVYMTQDIGTAQLRQNDYAPNQMVYVVGNEQDYHFKVLSIILDRLGFEWAKDLYHLSYGMVELPEGKMKSREGTVVDADDLMEEMIDTARKMGDELGKLDGLSDEQRVDTFKIIGMGALKYFILKVDPVKNMTFDPKESIDFNGNTGPFIQYTYARIQSVLRKFSDQNGPLMSKKLAANLDLSNKEKAVLKLINEFPQVVKEAGGKFSPAIIANYSYELAKEYNQFYHDHSVLNEPNEERKVFRALLSKVTAEIIAKGFYLLGIEVPERM